VANFLGHTVYYQVHIYILANCDPNSGFINPLASTTLHHLQHISSVGLLLWSNEM